MFCSCIVAVAVIAVLGTRMDSSIDDLIIDPNILSFGRVFSKHLVVLQLNFDLYFENVHC